jgi:hypothetical protein
VTKPIIKVKTKDKKPPNKNKPNGNQTGKDNNTTIGKTPPPPIGNEDGEVVEENLGEVSPEVGIPEK